MYRTLTLVAIVAASSVSVEARLNAGRGLQGKNNDKDNKEKNNDKDNKEKDNAAAAPFPTVPAPVFPAIPAGATEFMQIARDASANQYARKAQEAGYQIAALDMNGNTTLNTVQAAAPEKLLLVIGGEDKSVGQFILNMADHIIGIPQFGRVNSLNASDAAGIAMHALGGD